MHSYMKDLSEDASWISEYDNQALNRLEAPSVEVCRKSSIDSEW